MDTIKAEYIKIGDIIYVDLGKGVASKRVDHIKLNNSKNIITVYFYTESGSRPKLTLPFDQKVSIE